MLSQVNLSVRIQRLCKDMDLLLRQVVIILILNLLQGVQTEWKQSHSLTNQEGFIQEQTHMQESNWDQARNKCLFQDHH